MHSLQWKFILTCKSIFLSHASSAGSICVRFLDLINLSILNNSLASFNFCSRKRTCTFLFSLMFVLMFWGLRFTSSVFLVVGNWLLQTYFKSVGSRAILWLLYVSLSELSKINYINDVKLCICICTIFLIVFINLINTVLFDSRLFSLNTPFIKKKVFNFIWNRYKVR